MPTKRVAVAEHQAPADHPEGDRRGREDDEVLREDVDAVLRRGKARSRPGRSRRSSRTRASPSTSTQTVSRPMRRSLLDATILSAISGVRPSARAGVAPSKTAAPRSADVRIQRFMRSSRGSPRPPPTRLATPVPPQKCADSSPSARRSGRRPRRNPPGRAAQAGSRARRTGGGGRGRGAARGAIRSRARRHGPCSSSRMAASPLLTPRGPASPYHEFYLDDFEPRDALPAALGAHPADRPERARPTRCARRTWRCAPRA